MVNKNILFDIIKNKLIETVSKFELSKSKKGRKYKYSNLQCINVLLTVLFQGCSYRDACLHLEKNAFTSIFKRIQIWESNNLFSDLFTESLNKYKNDNKLNILYADSTDIKNICGLNININYSIKFKSKRAANLTLLCDDNKIPIIYEISKASKKDCNILEDIIVKNNLKSKNKTYIVADKGYFTKKVIRKGYKKRNIILVLPKKNYNKNKRKLKTKWYKRPRVRHSNKMKHILRNRYKVENLFARLHKTFKRLSNLYDKKITKYKMFIEIAFSALILEHFIQNPK